MKLNFCHKVAVHDCLPSSLPLDISGIEQYHTINKVLKTFCKGARFDPDQEVPSLELRRCFCSPSPSPSPTLNSSTLFHEDDIVQNSGLKDGHFVFVRRSQQLDTAVEEEEEHPGE